MGTELNETIARKVLATVDAGLVHGMGKATPGAMCVEAAVCFAYGLPHSDNPPCVGAAVRAFKIRLNDSKWSSNEARTAGLRALAIAQLGSDSIDQEAFRLMIAEGIIRRVLPVVLRAAARRQFVAHAEALNTAAQRCESEGTREAALEGKKAAYAAYAADAADATYAATYDAATYAADAADATYAAAAAYAADAAAAYAADAAAAYAADAAAAYAADAAAKKKTRDDVLMVAADVALQALIKLKSPGCQYLHLLEEVAT